MLTSPPLASPEKPIPLIMGGGPNMGQHFYYVEGEVAGPQDSYHLGAQKQSAMQIIVDIGANIGFFSISACKRFPKARIIAFEPHPANFRFLTHNLKAAGCADRVELHNKGVSSDGRSMKLYWHDSIGTSAFRKGPNFVPMHSISVEELWRIVGSAGSVSFMKVDCEGCEYEVVPLLQQWRVKTMVCETHGATVDTGKSKKLIGIVDKACDAHTPFNTSLTGGGPAWR